MLALLMLESSQDTLNSNGLRVIKEERKRLEELGVFTKGESTGIKDW